MLDMRRRLGADSIGAAALEWLKPGPPTAACLKLAEQRLAHAAAGHATVTVVKSGSFDDETELVFRLCQRTPLNS